VAALFLLAASFALNSKVLLQTSAIVRLLRYTYLVLALDVAISKKGGFP